jgi:hypothetical protein
MGWMTRWVGIWASVGSRIFFLHIIQTGSVAHPASFPVDTGVSFPGGKAARGWSWPLTSNYCQGQEKWSYMSTLPYCLHGVVLNYLSRGTTLLTLHWRIRCDKFSSEIHKTRSLFVVMYGCETFFLTWRECRLKVFKNWLLRRIHVHKRVRMQEDRENCIMKSSMMCTLH